MDRDIQAIKLSNVLKDMEIGKCLGRGATGQVFHALNKEYESVAIKKIMKRKLLARDLSNVVREISAMKALPHPNIIRLLEVRATKSNIYLIMEYASGGNLNNLARAKGKFGEDEARELFRQLIRAVGFSHSRGFCHRDIKLENMLIDGDGNLKLADFGLSIKTEKLRQWRCGCPRGTPQYMAPEVFGRFCGGYDGTKADIWACGVVLFILLSGDFPFGKNIVTLGPKIRYAEFRCPPGLSDQVQGLLRGLLEKNPRKRLPIQKILEHPWLAVGFEPVAEDKEQGGEDDFLRVRRRRLQLNAFDFISMAQGFDLRPLVVTEAEPAELRLASKRPAEEIIEKIEEIGKKAGFHVTATTATDVSMRRSEEGWKGRLHIVAAIFDIAPPGSSTPATHGVEVNKTSGDSLEYKKFRDEDLRPGLKDIAWAWLGFDR